MNTQVNPYLLFSGNCKEAFEFYAKSLHGTIEAMMTHAGTPAEASVGPEWADKILHASLLMNGQRIMASDAPPNHFSKPQGFSVSLTVDSVEEADRLYAELSDGAQITMPLSETFWARRFAMFVDRFGIPWIVNCPPQACIPT